MLKNRILLFATIAGAVFYADSSFALIPVAAMELSPPDVHPVAAVELAAPSLTPVTANELTAIAAIELMPASLGESADQRQAPSYDTAKIETPAASAPTHSNSTDNTTEAATAGSQTGEIAEQPKVTANSDYNPAVY